MPTALSSRFHPCLAVAIVWSAVFETGRCLSWAGVKHEGDFQQAITTLTQAVELHTAGNLEGTSRQTDQGIRLLDKVLRDLGVYDQMRAPGQ